MEKDQPFRIEYSTQVKAFFEKLADDNPETLEQITQGIRMFLEDPSRGVPVQTELIEAEADKLEGVKGDRIIDCVWLIKKEKLAERDPEVITFLAEIVEFAFDNGCTLELFDPWYERIPPCKDYENLKNIIRGSRLSSYGEDDAGCLRLEFEKEDLSFEITVPAWILKRQE